MKYYQSLCKSIGNYACYLLCLIDVAEEYCGTEFNKLDAIEMAIDKNLVSFNNKNYDDCDNFYVKNPAEILKLLTGKSWEVRKEDSKYLKKPNEYSIEYWSIDKKSGHFARMSKGFNSLQCSNNVKRGNIISYRICKPL